MLVASHALDRRRSPRRSGLPRRRRPNAAAIASANASCSSRLTPYCSATFSPVSPIDSSGNISSMRGFGKRQPSVVSQTFWSPPRRRFVGLCHHQRCAAHRLDSPRDEQVAVTGCDRMRGRDDRREPRRAEPVHGHAGDRLGQAGEERSHAGDVAVVLPRLVRCAEVDVLDLVRRDTGALDCLLDHRRREIVRPHAGKDAALTPDGRSDRRRRLTALDMAVSLGDELDAHGLVESADLLAAPQELANSAPPLVAVVLGQLVHVHAHEAVGELVVEARVPTATRTRARARGCRARRGSNRRGPPRAPAGPRGPGRVGRRSRRAAAAGPCRQATTRRGRPPCAARRRRRSAGPRGSGARPRPCRTRPRP